MSTSQKTLGILGGMGPMASSLLYEKITAKTKATCDQDHINILLYSHASLPDRTQAIQSGNTAELLENLSKDLQFLEKSGAEVLAIPCNTSHFFYEQLSQSVEVPLLNMISLCVEDVAKKQPKKVAVLATEGTLATRLYQTKLEAQGLSCYELPCHIQDRVNQLIYGEIKQGLPGCPENFAQIHDYLMGQEVDCVILACTELSVYATQQPLSPLYVDALDSLTHAIIQQCGGTMLTGGERP